MINWLRKRFTKKHINEKRKIPTSNVSPGRGLPVIDRRYALQEIYRCSDGCCFVPTKMVVTNRSDQDIAVLFVDADLVDHEYVVDHNTGTLSATRIWCEAKTTKYLGEDEIKKHIILKEKDAFVYGICGTIFYDIEDGISVLVEGYEYEMETNK